MEDALAILRLLPTPMAGAVAKVVHSAAANAENNEMLSVRDLRIIKAHADQGIRFQRFRPQARGRMGSIIKRRTHVTIVVEEEQISGA